MDHLIIKERGLTFAPEAERRSAGPDRIPARRDSRALPPSIRSLQNCARAQRAQFRPSILTPPACIFCLNVGSLAPVRRAGHAVVRAPQTGGPEIRTGASRSALARNRKRWSMRAVREPPYNAVYNSARQDLSRRNVLIGFAKRLKATGPRGTLNASGFK